MSGPSAEERAARPNGPRKVGSSAAHTEVLLHLVTFHKPVNVLYVEPCKVTTAVKKQISLWNVVKKKQ